MAAHKLYHLVQKDLWEASKAQQKCYYPPTYEQVMSRCSRACAGPQRPRSGVCWVRSDGQEPPAMEARYNVATVQRR